jgi:hypothetical protein
MITLETLRLKFACLGCAQGELENITFLSICACVQHSALPPAWPDARHLLKRYVCASLPAKTGYVIMGQWALVLVAACINRAILIMRKRAAWSPLGFYFYVSVSVDVIYAES